VQLFTQYREVEPHITKDGSIICELMHPSVHGNSNQSLAEATVPAGGKTILHKHHLTEEIYHITEGSGIMTLGSEGFEVKKGDSISLVIG
jgi:mannose-6-phosphate isomerase-like protein (cupin superfamily)